MDRPKRVAIVGSGASGLPAIRHAVLYGFETVCYETQNDIGGLWRYKPEETEESSVMKGTIINTSKEMTAYSDYPPPPEEANFMHNTRMLQYLLDYAHHYDLRKYILFNTKVVNIERTPDYQKTGQWKLHIKHADGRSTYEVFDGVMVCSGHHTIPHWPEPWPGQDKFTGNIIHSHSYKDHRGYEDKTVVVVGVGNSGGDVAVELSKIAKQVYLVTRRGSWIFNRIFDYGRPFDCELTTRFNYLARQFLPSLSGRLIEYQLNKKFDHHVYGLRPAHGVLGAHPTVNDELPNRIAGGVLKVKPQIKEFTEHGVQFVDGTSVDNVHTVILSTGYSFEFNVVEDGNLLKVNENEVDLYQYIFPTDLPHDTLGIIGLIQPYGSIMPVSEMQARVFLDTLAGRTKLPSGPEKIRAVKDRRNALQKRYVKSRRHTVQVDYLTYMDELASMIGCRPSIPTLLANDFMLGVKAFFGPCSAYYYRLMGPHTWKGAREAIMGIEDRIVQATNPTAHPPWHPPADAVMMVVYMCTLSLTLLFTFCIMVF